VYVKQTPAASQPMAGTQTEPVASQHSIISKLGAPTYSYDDGDEYFDTSNETEEMRKIRKHTEGMAYLSMKFAVELFPETEATKETSKSSIIKKLGPRNNIFL